jgi:hypothetical protein
MQRFLRASSVTGALCLALIGCGPRPEITAAARADRAWASVTELDDGRRMDVVTQAWRLRPDVLRAFSAMHWAVLRAEGGELGIHGPELLEATPWGPATRPSDEAPPEAVVMLRAWALLPDGRTAAITAWRAQPPAWIEQPTDDQRQVFHVRIVVGRFGDAAVESAFLDQLRALLAGEPPRQRVRFTLP